MIPEHQRAILTVDLPENNLQAGDMGTVVHIYDDQQAYEVEFFTAAGQTLDVVTVEASQVRPASQRDVLHVREILA